MHQKLAIFDLAGQMAQHAGTRQAVVSANVANADTPGYQAMRIASFADSYQAGPPPGMKRTHAKHIGGGTGAVNARMIAAATEPSPNGNSVSLEDEMLAAVDVAREHSRALAIYRHGLTVLRTTLGRS